MTIFINENKIIDYDAKIEVNYHSKILKYYLIIKVSIIYTKQNDYDIKFFIFDLDSNDWENEIHIVLKSMEEFLTKKERVKIGSYIGHNLNSFFNEKICILPQFKEYRRRVVNVGSLLIRNRNYLAKTKMKRELGLS